MDKLKGIIHRIKIDKILTFCKHNVRYFGAAAVFVAIVLVLAFGTNGTASEKDPMAGAYQNYAEDDNEEVRAIKEFNQRILVDKKPYFFAYVYPSMGKEYKQYISNANRKALFQFGITLNDLLHKEY